MTAFTAWLYIAGAFGIYLAIYAIVQVVRMARDGDLLFKNNQILQAENESLANYRRLWEAAALELRTANAKIAKLEKVPKKVKK